MASGLLLVASQPLMFGRFDVLAHGAGGVLAFVALVPWLLAIRKAPASQAAALTFVTCFVHFAGTLHWLYNAIHIYGGQPVVTALFGLFVLCTVQAALMAPAGAVVAFTGSRGLPAWVIAPLAWAGVEMLRAWALTGFPWSSLAMTQWALPTAQLADLAGLHGIHILVVMVNAAWLSGPRRTGAIVAGSLLLAGSLYGIVRANQMEVRYVAAPQVLRVGLLQGNIAQNVKHDRAYRDEIVARYNALARRADDRGAELIVWPEAALPYTVHRRTRALSQTKLHQPTRGQHLIGVASYWHEPDRTDEDPSLANSAFLVDGDRRVQGRYDKAHLVPFGEYVPFPLPGFTEKLVEGTGDYVPGVVEPLTLDGGEKIGVLICYEAVFPELSRALIRDGAELLVNITNDAWPGRTSGVRQHLVLARYRAIETRRPLVRAANTGISAIITPSGRVVAATELNQTVVVVDDVHLASGRSLYVVVGDTFGWLALGSLLVLPVAAVTIRRRRAT